MLREPSPLASASIMLLKEVTTFAYASSAPAGSEPFESIRTASRASSKASVRVFRTDLFSIRHSSRGRLRRCCILRFGCSAYFNLRVCQATCLSVEQVVLQCFDLFVSK